MNARRIKIGDRFGRLTVIEKTLEHEGKCLIWLCRCDCGNERAVASKNLLDGSVADCGCTAALPKGVKNIKGQRFGKLVAVELSEERIC